MAAEPIRRWTTGLLMAGVLATALASSPAQAATTYTPTGGPEANFVGSSVSFTAGSQTLTCTQFDLAGDIVNSGTNRAYGANGGTLTDLTSSGCTNPIVGATTVTPVGTWGVTIAGDATGSEWPATLTNVTADVVAAGCSFEVSGDLSGTFDDSSQLFTPDAGTGSGLALSSSPTGDECYLLGLSNGDPISVDGTWTNTPPSGGNPIDIANPPTTTYTPTGGPEVTLASDNIGMTIATQTITCDGFELVGPVVNSADIRTYGASASTLSEVETDCTNPIWGDTPIRALNDWGLAITGGETGGGWPAQLTDVRFEINAAGCVVEASGNLSGTFNDSTQVFTPDAGSGSGLALSTTPTGGLCFFMGWSNGDPVSVSGTWTNTPPPGSTALDIATP